MGLLSGVGIWKRTKGSPVGAWACPRPRGWEEWLPKENAVNVLPGRGQAPTDDPVPTLEKGQPRPYITSFEHFHIKRLGGTGRCVDEELAPISANLREPKGTKCGVATNDREGREGASPSSTHLNVAHRADVIPNGGAGPHPRVYPVTTLAVVR